MSYNVTSTDTLRSTLTISKEAWRKWRNYEDFPESNPLDNIDESSFGEIPTCSNGHLQAAGKPFCAECGECFSEDNNGPAPIENFRWTGVWSGNSYFDVLAKFVADTAGEADVLLTWEGGDSQSAIRIKDGKVTQHELKWVFGDPCEKQPEGWSK
jgi:hypothetical protein